MEGLYNVLDVCWHTIIYSNNKGYGISNLKLQKILYFIQAYFVINKDNDKPCFRERIEAWSFGPVVPVAYQEYKQYGSVDIPTRWKYYEINESNLWESKLKTYDIDKIKKEDREKIEAVVDKFAVYSATDLVTLTHNQAPWKDAYEPYKNNEITIEALRRYFNGE